MFSKVAACWLVALVLAPFTAPFPTCDLASLLGGGAQTQDAPGHLPASAIVNDSVIDSVPAIGSSRVRLTVVAGVFASPAECVAATATSTRTSAPAGGVRDQVGLSTNLRL